MSIGLGWVVLWSVLLGGASWYFGWRQGHRGLGVVSKHPRL